MEGKPIVPGLGPELQPNPAEQVNPTFNQELTRSAESTPAIQSRPVETTTPPPLSSELNTAAAPVSEVASQSVTSPERGLPSRDEIKTMDLTSLNEIQNAVFDHWAEE